MTMHRYTKEQDDFIRGNYKNIQECVEAFNERFGTSLSYGAIKTHAFKRLGLTTNYRPWTKDMNESIAELIKKYPYKIATKEFNKKHGTDFSLRQIQGHCVAVGIKRGFYGSLKEVDQIIADNIDKPYEEIMHIVNSQTTHKYTNRTAICVRANNLGLSRPHRVWDHKNDKRIINGEEVEYNEHVRFVTNKYHRVSKELQPIALQLTRLQAEIAKREEVE